MSLMHGALVGGVVGAGFGTGIQYWRRSPTKSGEKCKESNVRDDPDALQAWNTASANLEPEEAERVGSQLSRLLSLQQLVSDSAKDEVTEYPHKAHTYVEAIRQVLQTKGKTPAALEPVEEFVDDTRSNIVMAVQQRLAG
jgi:hypothetical protein